MPKWILILLCTIGWVRFDSSGSNFYYGSQKALNTEFELIKTAEGIEVYIAKHPKKGFITYRAHTELNEKNIQNLLDYFADASQHPHWVYNCTSSKHLDIGGKSALYQICQSPWPYKDRDLSLLVYTAWHGDSKAAVHFNSSPNIVPRNHRLVRIEDFTSSWTVEKLGDKTKVTVETRFNPKLKLGRSILNWYSVKIPFETLKKLRQHYKEKK